MVLFGDWLGDDDWLYLVVVVDCVVWMVEELELICECLVLMYEVLIDLCVE